MLCDDTLRKIHSVTKSSNKHRQTFRLGQHVSVKGHESWGTITKLGPTPITICMSGGGVVECRVFDLMYTDTITTTTTTTTPQFDFLVHAECHGTTVEQIIDSRVRYRCRTGWVTGNSIIPLIVQYKDDDEKWVDQFTVKESVGCGRGLFANRDFAADEIITIYAGILCELGSHSAKYTAAVGNRLIDAASEDFFFAKYINSHHVDNNCHLTSDKDDDYLEGRIIALRAIDKGEEILMNYHDDQGLV